ncbi:MAG TPA: hypothetical protein VHF23_04880 [Gaiellaceae bacterium]|nr:hypothetical protein [Gaiellaceae bacterium]
MRPCALALLLAALLAGCGGNGEGDAGNGATAGSSGLAAGPAISVGEALDSGSDEPLLVSGNLLAEAGRVRLCSALAESFPPQCVGAALRVEGLKLAEVDGLVSEGDVSWTDRPTELLGVVRDGVLTVSQNATA